MGLRGQVLNKLPGESHSPKFGWRELISLLGQARLVQNLCVECFDFIYSLGFSLSRFVFLLLSLSPRAGCIAGSGKTAPSGFVSEFCSSIYSWVAPLLKHVSCGDCETGTQGLTQEAGSH